MKKVLIGLLLLGTSLFAGDGDPIRVYPALAGKTTAIEEISQDPFWIILAVDSAADSTEGTFYTEPIPMKDYGAIQYTLFGYNIQERDSGNVFDQVVGSGDFDLGSGGTYTGDQDTVLWLKIAAEGTPDVFVYSWGDSSAGTDSFSVSPDTIEITKGVAQSLGLGKTVTFADDDNHDADDVFKLICYADGYAGYIWKDTLPDSSAVIVQVQTFTIPDSIMSIVADTIMDTGVVQLWAGKGTSYVGGDSLLSYTRLRIRIRDSLGDGAIDTANSQYRYFYNIIAQRKQ
jgi:hypothetical protein